MDTLLSIADLIADPTLDTTVLAGRNGLGRTVRWAQTSESAEPWRWLGEGELLMTLGLNLPADAAGQCDFIHRANNAGIVGITIGQDGLAPPITAQMRRLCDELGFPLLSTGDQTPFVVIARTVAAVTTNQLNRGVLVLSRLYQQAGSLSPQRRRSGKWITDLCGTTVTVLDTLTGCAIIGKPRSGALRRHSLNTLRPTQLLIDADSRLDALILVHLKQILSVDSNSLLQQAQAEIEQGEIAVKLALDGAPLPAPFSAASWLGSAGTYRAMATESSLASRLAMAMALNQIPPLLTVWKNHCVALVREKDLSVVSQLVDQHELALGASGPHRGLTDFSGAAEEALSGYEECEGRVGVNEFAGRQISILSRSDPEARTMISKVLGPLAGDDNQATVFRGTLFALLDADLQGQRTAHALNIHRQTLAYRMRQVEALTGRSTRVVADLAELYLARKAWQRLGLPE